MTILLGSVGSISLALAPRALECNAMTDILEAIKAKKQIARTEREAAVIPAMLGDKELLITIARFEHAGMDDQQIARGIGRSVLEVQSIRAHEIYQEQLAETAGIVAVREITVDEMYAQLELAAITQMQSYLAVGSDPQYAMQAARIANAAQSRVAKRAEIGSNNLRANNDRTANVTVVLNQKFVQRLSGMDFDDERKRADDFNVGVPIRRTINGNAKIDAVPDAKTARATIAPAVSAATKIADDLLRMSSFSLAAERTI